MALLLPPSSLRGNPSSTSPPTPASPLLRYFLPLAVGASLATVPLAATRYPLSITGLGVLCAGIGAAYSIDRLIDPGPLASPKSSLLPLGVALICVCTLLILFCLSPLSMAINGGCLGLLSLGYPRLKRIPFLKNAIVAFAWVWGISLFPFGGDTPTAWLFFPSTLPLLILIYAACILCDIKDLQHDREEAVHTFPLTFGLSVACGITASLSLIGGYLAYRAGLYLLLPTALFLLLIALLPRYFREGDRGMNTVDALFLLPGIFYFFLG